MLSSKFPDYPIEREYDTLPVSDCAYRAYDSMLVLKAACEAAGSNDGEAVARLLALCPVFRPWPVLQDFTTGDGEGCTSSISSSSTAKVHDLE